MADGNWNGDCVKCTRPGNVYKTILIISVNAV